MLNLWWGKQLLQSRKIGRFFESTWIPRNGFRISNLYFFGIYCNFQDIFLKGRPVRLRKVIMLNLWRGSSCYRAGKLKVFWIDLNLKKWLQDFQPVLLLLLLLLLFWNSLQFLINFFEKMDLFFWEKSSCWTCDEENSCYKAGKLKGFLNRPESQEMVSGFQTCIFFFFFFFRNLLLFLIHFF